MQSKPLSILYVEDDRDLVLLVQERLAQAGIVVEAAYDGKEALSKYSPGSHDLLAIDQMLPLLDGLGVLRAIASRGPLPPTVMVTGAGDEKVAVQTMKLGADDYIVKDLAGKWLDLLPSIIERVLRQRRLVKEKQAAEAALLERERQLWHAQKHESLGVLAGGIAHDFNNILAGIMGYADLALVELPAAEPVRAHIEVIKKSVRRAADLTRQMLAYSGTGKIVVEPVSLTRSVQDLSRMLQVSLSKKAVLKQDLLPGLPLIQADASQIDQVIMNLIINASEALDEQGGEISISTGAVQCTSMELEGMGFGLHLAEGLYVRLEVADTGCGMDPQTRAKIFDPFFTTKLAGRGLGLAAVQGIVQGHKGAIRVSSEPGKGSTFEVFFPASDIAHAPATSESTKEEENSGRCSGIGPAGFQQKPREPETGIAGLEEAIGAGSAIAAAIDEETYRDYLSALLAGKRHRCSEIVNRLVRQGLPIRRLHVDLFQASLYEVGELWATNRISVAIEHMATAITEGLLNQLSPNSTSRERAGKAVVVAAIRPELHQVGGKIVADTFEMCGWDSFYLGSDIAPNEIVQMVREIQPHLVALSLTRYVNLSAVRAAIEELRRDFPRLPIIVGGRGFHAGGAEIAHQYAVVRYISSLDELDLYIQQHCRNLDS